MAQDAQQPPAAAEVGPEHRWLQRLVGEWAAEGEMPDAPPEAEGAFSAVEVGRAIGDYWVLLEGAGKMPGCGDVVTVMTLGYDPARGRFVGTWVGSMMSTLWIYDGSLDPATDTLTLQAEGPSFDQPGKTAQYRDVISLAGDDRRTLTSFVQGDDGGWTQFMQAHYRRTG